MKCKQCGAEVDGSRTYCPFCGVKLEEEIFSFADEPKPESTSLAGDGLSSSAERDFEGVSLGSATTANEPAVFPMKWFKFLIYFALFVSAIASIFTATQYLTGSHYTDVYGNIVADQVYATFPSMKALDMVMAFLYVGFAALAIWARFALASYKKKGPTLLYLMNILSVVATVIYAFASASITGSEDVLLTAVIECVINVIYCLIWVGLNMVYFKKRAELFVN